MRKKECISTTIAFQKNKLPMNQQPRSGHCGRELQRHYKLVKWLIGRYLNSLSSEGSLPVRKQVAETFLWMHRIANGIIQPGGPLIKCLHGTDYDVMDMLKMLKI